MVHNHSGCSVADLFLDVAQPFIIVHGIGNVWCPGVFNAHMGCNTHLFQGRIDYTPVDGVPMNGATLFIQKYKVIPITFPRPFPLLPQGFRYKFKNLDISDGTFRFRLFI